MAIIWLLAAFILLVNQLPTSRGQSDVCPESCECPTEVEVSCSLNSTGLPSGIPTTTTELEVTCFAPGFITPRQNLFSSLPALQSLRVRNCINQALVAGTFNGLNNLTYLHFSDNLIPSLGPNIFNDTPNVNHLVLTNNSISTIGVGTFSGLSNITHIYFDNNQLKAIDHRVFEDLSGSVNVQFGGNPLVCDCNLIPIWEKFRQFNRDTVCPLVNSLGNNTWERLNVNLLNQTCGEIAEQSNSGLPLELILAVSVSVMIALLVLISLVYALKAIKKKRQNDLSVKSHDCCVNAISDRK